MNCSHLTSLPRELLLRLQRKLYFSQFASTDVCLRPAVTRSPSLVLRLTLSKCAMNTMATKKQPPGTVAVRWDMPDSKYDGVVHFVSDSLVDEVGNGRVVVWWPNCSKGKRWEGQLVGTVPVKKKCSVFTLQAYVFTIKKST